MPAIKKLRRRKGKMSRGKFPKYLDDYRKKVKAPKKARWRRDALSSSELAKNRSQDTCGTEPWGVKWS